MTCFSDNKQEKNGRIIPSVLDDLCTLNVDTFWFYHIILPGVICRNGAGPLLPPDLYVYVLARMPSGQWA